MFFLCAPIVSSRYTPRIDRKGRADQHPEAYLWDKAETHINLALDLLHKYDGFAIACTTHSLSTYLSVIPTHSENGIRILSWVKPASLPSGSRITQSWESVIIKVPKDRKGRGKGKQMVDYLIFQTLLLFYLLL